jgi:hypothetical protein
MIKSLLEGKKARDTILESEGWDEMEYEDEMNLLKEKQYMFISPEWQGEKSAFEIFLANQDDENHDANLSDNEREHILNADINQTIHVGMIDMTRVK